MLSPTRMVTSETVVHFARAVTTIRVAACLRAVTSVRVVTLLIVMNSARVVTSTRAVGGIRAKASMRPMVCFRLMAVSSERALSLMRLVNFLRGLSAIICQNPAHIRNLRDPPLPVLGRRAKQTLGRDARQRVNYLTEGKNLFNWHKAARLASLNQLEMQLLPSQQTDMEITASPGD